MKWISVFLIFISVKSMAASTSTVSEFHGPITLGLGIGYGNYRLMNSDGTWSSYRGPNYLGTLEIHVWKFENSGSISIFGDYSYSKATDASQESAKLEHQGVSYGIRLYANPYFFVGLGMGNGTEKTTTNGSEISLRHPVTAAQIGFEWQMGGSWSLGFQGRYQTGSISREDNRHLSNNSSFDALEGIFLLNWSPPVLVVNGR